MTGSVLSWSITASLAVVLLYPVLYLTVSRCRSFIFNRAVGLSSVFLSALLPLALSAYSHVAAMPGFDSADAVTQAGTMVIGSVNAAAVGVGSGIFAILLWVYLAGIAFFSGRELLSFISLFVTIAHCQKVPMGGYTLCVDKSLSSEPFSWGKYIIMRHTADKTDRMILLHEAAHVRKKHWVDILIADLLCIMLWYNPFAWLMRGLIIQNNEYAADAAVIESDADAREYKLVLLNSALKSHARPLVNSFAASIHKLRRRIAVMNGSNNGKTAGRWIAALAVPALVLALVAAGNPLSAEILGKVAKARLVLPEQSVAPEAAEVAEVTAQVAPLQETEYITDYDIEPEYPGGKVELLYHLVKHISYPDITPQNKSVKIGLCISENGDVVKRIVLESAGKPFDDAALEATEGLLKFTPGSKGGKLMPCLVTVPVRFQYK